MTNFVLCFDARETSATAMVDLLEQSDEQVAWRHRESVRRDAFQRSRPDHGVRGALAAGYEFLAGEWEPGDRIFVVGSGIAGYSAQALTRLLGTVGLLPPMWRDLVGFVLGSYALPRTRRTTEDWRRVRELIADLNGGVDAAVPVAYLGLWDAIRPHGLPAPSQLSTSNVEAGRHAIAIDGGPRRHHVLQTPSDRVQDVWFRGGHRDLVGGVAGCERLGGIAADWLLDGLVSAGARLADDRRGSPSEPACDDALAAGTRGGSHRTLPSDAAVHASVEVYLRDHPDFRRRLPSRVTWVDGEWLARGERLATEAPVVRARHEEPAAIAS